jgi:hypothetical protein
MRRLRLALLAVACLGLDGCDLSETVLYEDKVVTNGDPARGRALIASGVHGCTTCHAVPGMRGVQGVVGPPLSGLARRGFIAGSCRTSRAFSSPSSRIPRPWCRKRACRTSG